ncbi:MAG: CHASE domain-containing protein, partial [Betaproteobacteria bacterium]
MQQAIEEQLDAYLGLLRDGAALFVADREPTEAQFRAFVEQLNVSKPDIVTRSRRMQSSEVRYPGLLGMAWIRVEPERSGRPARPQANEMRLPLGGDSLDFVHIEPPEWRTQAMAGLEMFIDPSSRIAMERARDSGKAAMSGKVTVIREFWAKKRSGFHLFLPLYHGGGVPMSQVARRRALRGFVVASVQAEEMLSALRPEDARGDIAMQVYDGNQTATTALLFSSDASHPTWDASYRPRLSATNVTDGAGRSWGTVFYTLPEFELSSSRGIAPNVLLIGVLISLLLAGINLVQRRAGAALNASEVRYRRLFEASPDGVFLFDAQSGRINNINPAMAELLGRTREQLVGKFLWEIGLFGDEAAGRAAFMQLQDKHYHRFHDLPVVTPAGKHHDVEFTCNAYMANGKRFMQCNIRNVTDRRRAENALRDSEERYRSLVEVSPQGVWIVDRAGSPLFINRYWVEYSGVDLERGADDAWLEQVHPDDRDRMLEHWQR